jgi:hypothetical protein
MGRLVRIVGVLLVLALSVFTSVAAAKGKPGGGGGGSSPTGGLSGLVPTPLPLKPSFTLSDSPDGRAHVVYTQGFKPGANAHDLPLLLHALKRPQHARSASGSGNRGELLTAAEAIDAKVVVDREDRPMPVLLRIRDERGIGQIRRADPSAAPHVRELRATGQRARSGRCASAARAHAARGFRPRGRGGTSSCDRGGQRPCDEAALGGVDSP